MSHIVTIKTQVRDPVALASACTRLGLQPPTHGTAQLYSQQATGYQVHLPGWMYPAVVDTITSEIHTDTYNGAWGNPQELDKLLQAYSVEKAILEARKQGHSITERTLADGSIKLTIAVSGGEA